MRNAELHTALSWVIVLASELASAGDVDGALAELERFRIEHRALETQEWADNAVFLQQGLILRHAGRCQRALEMHRAVRLQPHDRFPYLLNADCTARALRELGRPGEALQVLQDALQAAEGGSSVGDLPTIDLAFDLSGETGLPVGQEMFCMAVQVLGLCGVQILQSQANDFEAVGRALTAAVQRARERQA